MLYSQYLQFSAAKLTSRILPCAQQCQFHCLISTVTHMGAKEIFVELN